MRGKHKMCIRDSVYAVLSYLIGSIPSGLIIGKFFFNTDVRQYGSKNIGATNTYRVIGLKAALPVFLCDALKGAVGVVLLSPYGPMFMILGGILGMMGHNWSVFLGFKGGRGVATGLGVLDVYKRQQIFLELVENLLYS